MKLKKLLIISIILLTVFLIYLTTMDKKVYFVGLGDDLSLGLNNQEQITGGYNQYIKEYLKNKDLLEEYIIEFSKQDDRTTDLINAIESNEKIKIGKKEKTIKNILIKADLITLSIGANDLSYKIKTGNKISIYDYIDEYLKDLEKLFLLIKDYCKEDIVYISFYNPYGEEYDNYYKYANEQTKKICKKYNIIWVDTLILNQKNNLNLEQGKYPTKEGYQTLSNQIIKELEKTLLK